MTGRFLHIVLFLVLLPWQVSAENEAFSQGVKAHATKDYVLSARKFMQALREEPDNISAYYNYGLAEMGNRHFGRAIWGFEKVLKFDPNDSEAYEKLETCYRELNPGSHYRPILGGFDATMFGISSNTWGILAISFSVLFCLSAVLFRIRKEIPIRRVLMIVAFASLAGLVFSTVYSARSHQWVLTHHYAVVPLKNTPTYIDASNRSQRMLDEGTRLTVQDDHFGEMVHVKDESGTEFLMRSRDLLFF